jgi:hypothetical protein
MLDVSSSIRSSASLTVSVLRTDTTFNPAASADVGAAGVALSRLADSLMTEPTWSSEDVGVIVARDAQTPPRELLRHDAVAD